MNTSLIIQLGCSLLTTVLCGYLIHFYRERYPFSKPITALLVSVTGAGSLCFGILQPEPGMPQTALETLLIGSLIYLSATDLKAYEIPDRVNLLIGGLGICHLMVAPFPPLSGLLTAILLFSFFFFLAFISNGGVGGGDIKYALVIGLWFPPSLILPFLLLSTLSASIYGVLSLVISKENRFLPFGPFLVLATIYLLFMF